ncbi:hypothetical protein GCM10023201_07460 [Actinomycetospora corticicola]
MVRAVVRAAVGAVAGDEGRHGGEDEDDGEQLEHDDFLRGQEVVSLEWLDIDRRATAIGSTVAG